jgi:hypothetical protein
MAIRLVSFDALFTILAPRLPIYVQYSQTFAPYLGELEPESLKDSFKIGLYSNACNLARCQKLTRVWKRWNNCKLTNQHTDVMMAHRGGGLRSLGGQQSTLELIRKVLPLAHDCYRSNLSFCSGRQFSAWDCSAPHDPVQLKGRL